MDWWMKNAWEWSEMGVLNPPCIVSDIHALPILVVMQVFANQSEPEPALTEANSICLLFIEFYLSIWRHHHSDHLHLTTWSNFQKCMQHRASLLWFWLGSDASCQLALETEKEHWLQAKQCSLADVHNQNDVFQISIQFKPTNNKRDRDLKYVEWC